MNNIKSHSYFNESLNKHIKILMKFNFINKIFVYPLVYILVSLFYATSVFGAVLDSKDFENGSLGKLRVIGNQQNLRIKSAPSPVCSGQFSSEFYLKSKNAKSRTELVGMKPNNFKIGSEYWIGFAVFLSKDWKIDNSRASNDSIWNLHGVPDQNIGETWRNAPIALNVNKDKWVLRRGWCAKKKCNGKDNSKKFTDIAKWEAGKWTEFVFNIKLSYKNDGFIKIWKDGVGPITIKGPNAYNDSKGPYMKYGIYKSSWGKSDGGKASGFASRKLYYDNIVVGDRHESYSSVAPNCGKSFSLSPPKNLSIK